MIKSFFRFNLLLYCEMNKLMSSSQPSSKVEILSTRRLLTRIKICQFVINLTRDTTIRKYKLQNEVVSFFQL